jgi:hypothetical protein
MQFGMAPMIPRSKFEGVEKGVAYNTQSALGVEQLLLEDDNAESRA